MPRVFTAFWDFWFKPLPAQPVAAFRICIGLILLLDTGFTLLPNAAMWFGPEGRYSQNEFSWWIQGGRWSLFSANTSVETIQLGLVALMCCAYGLVFGIATRFFAIAAFVLLVSFHNRNPNILNAADILLRNALFYLALMPSWRAWSLDRAVVRRWGWDAAPLSSAWPVRLAQIQICFVYLFTGIEKLRHFKPDNIHASDWIDGTAVALSWRFTTIARTPWLTGIPDWVTAPMAWATLLWEVAFPALVVWRRSRPAALAFGVLVHAGIFATMEVTHFSLTTLAFYWLFVPASVLMDMAGKSENGSKRYYRVFYDTMCPVCNRGKRLLTRLDWLGRLKFEDLHDRKLCESCLPGVTYADQLRAMYVLRPDGKYFAGFNAVRALMPVLPIFWIFWPLWMLAWIPGFSHLGRAVYRYIAKNRFKYASCDSEVCSLHLKLIAGKEMDDEVIAQVVALHERFNKARAANAPA